MGIILSRNIHNIARKYTDSFFMMMMMRILARRQNVRNGNGKKIVGHVESLVVQTFLVSQAGKIN